MTISNKPTVLSLTVTGAILLSSTPLCADDSVAAVDFDNRRADRALVVAGIGAEHANTEISAVESVEQRVKNIVAEQLGVKIAEVQTDASFVEDLGADSLDSVELIMALEEEFEMEIPDEEAEKMTTVALAIAYITSNKK